MPQSETRRSLVFCSLEGMCAAVVGACSSGAVLAAWAHALDASPLVLSLVWAFPYLGQLAQPWAAWLTAAAGPKRLALGATTLSRQALWVLAFLPFLASPSTSLAVLVAIFAVAALAGVVGNNAWTSWVAGMVPARVRGRYFGRRNARAALVGTIASIGVGALLDRRAAQGHEVQALAWVSACGAAMGIACSLLMSRQHEPLRPPVPADREEPRAVALAPFRDPKIRRVLAFQLVWSASTGIAASHYSAHALTRLAIGVTGLAVYNTALAASRFFAMPFWGNALDRAGARSVLVACALLSSFGASLWVVTAPGRTWPLALDAVVSGVALGGIELAVFSMPMALGSPAETPAVVAAVAMVSGLAFGGACVGGGAVLTRAGVAGAGGATRALFAVSALGRVAASLVAVRLVALTPPRPVTRARRP